MAPVTARTPGTGATSLSYTLTSNTFDVESVYASIDATAAAGPVTAELTIQDQSGVVIARKVQTQTIAAGAPGSATWALRLDDDTASGGGGALTVQNARYSVTTTTVNSLASKFLPLNALSFGTALLDLTTPDDPTVLYDGIYVFSCQFRVVIALGGAPIAGSGHTGTISNGGGGQNASSFFTYPTAGSGWIPQWTAWTIPAKKLAGDDVRISIFNGDNTSNRVYDATGFAVARLSS